MRWWEWRSGSTVAGRRSWFAAELTVTAERVELAVHDPGGADRPRLAQPPDPLADPDLPAEAFEHGRGLALVGAFSDAWGFTGDDNGCVVWASFDLTSTASNDGHADAGAQPPHDGAPQPDSDDSGTITHPPDNVLSYLLGRTTGSGPARHDHDGATP